MKGSFLKLFVVASMAALVVGCSQSDGPMSVENRSTGDVPVVVNLEKVGSLAKATKTAAISLDSIVFDLTATGETPVHHMIPISGNSQQVVNTSLELAAGKNWSMTVRTYDDERPMDNVHYGSTSFDVVEGSNPPVTMSIDAQYSMLMVRINPVPDSSTFMALYQGNDPSQLWSLWDDTTYSKGEKPATDTVKLYYDWLNVGMSTNIQVLIRGDWEGQPNTDLYWGTLNIPDIVAGQDAAYTFTLGWIGPSATTGTVPIEVTVGSVGLITVDGDISSDPPVIPDDPSPDPKP